MSITALKASAQTPVEIWITPNGTEGGSGTETDPFRTPTADSFFNLIHGNPRGSLGVINIPEHSTIHLMPGTFLVREGVTVAGGVFAAGLQRFCLSPKNGWKIRGAGIDATVLKVIANHPAASAGGKLGVIAGNGGIINSAWTVPIDGVEASDLTVDLNLQNQSVIHCPSAVSLGGSDNRLSRIRGINWGSTWSGGECFVLALAGHFSLRPEGYNNGVIEDCIVEQPAPGVANVQTTTAISVGAPDPVQSRKTGGWVIRGCVVRNITVGSSAGIPSSFNAYGAGGRGCEISGNYAYDLISEDANHQINSVYADTWDNNDIVIRDNSFLNVRNGIIYWTYAYSQTNIAVLNNLITVTNGGTGISFWATTGVMRKLRINGNIVYPHVAGTVLSSAIGATGDIEFSANDNVADSGGGTGYDFFTSAGSWTTLKVLSFKNNHNLRGKPFKLGNYAQIDSKFTGFYDEDLTFTPTTTGWHKILLNQELGLSMARLNIWSIDTLTDFEVAYAYNPYVTGLGELTMTWNCSADGIGAIPRVRLARYSNFDVSESAYGQFAQGAVEVEVSTAQVGKPLNIRISGMLRAPAYLNNFEPYSVPSGITLVASKEIVIGPGIRTAGPIYAGSSGQQITDASGHILSPALNIVQPAQGGLGINATTIAQDMTPYTAPGGVFGWTMLTPFARTLLDDTDAATARTTLGAQANNANLTTIAGLSTAAGNLMVGNGSSWGTLPIGTAGKALMSSGTAVSWSPAPTGVKTTADQTINGTAYQTISGLGFPVVANTDYAFEFTIVFTSTAATGFGFSVSGPSPSQIVYIDYVVTYQTTANATAGTDVMTQRHDIAYDAMPATTATVTGGVNLHAHIKGTLRTGAITPGTLSARVRSESANNDLVVKRGSWGTYF